MLSLRSPGSRYQDAWQLLGRFLYTSSPPELPAGPDTIVALLFNRVLVVVVMVMVENVSGGCCDLVVSLTGEDNDIYADEPLYIQVHALL